MPAKGGKGTVRSGRRPLAAGLLPRTEPARSYIMRRWYKWSLESKFISGCSLVVLLYCLPSERSSSVQNVRVQFISGFIFTVFGLSALEHNASLSQQSWSLPQASLSIPLFISYSVQSFNVISNSWCNQCQKSTRENFRCEIHAPCQRKNSQNNQTRSLTFPTCIATQELAELQSCRRAI